ncbi:MAG: hypothetical protein WD749_03200 [Phycisphaerales bacterium]
MTRLAIAILAAAALGGCASSPVVGTWTGRGGAGTAPFSFGSVSFVGDQTFTAEARYGGNIRVQSGTWSAQGDRLMLSTNGAQREYTYKVEGGELVVTEPKSGHSITLDRLKK